MGFLSRGEIAKPDLLPVSLDLRDPLSMPLIPANAFEAGRLRVHRGVALAWIGEPPRGRECVAHLDGDRTNNCVSNLAWVSYKENEEHKRLHGTMIVGSASPHAKLSDAKVAEIRRRRRAGEGVHSLSRKFNVSTTTVRHAAIGRTWAHVAEDAFK